MKKLLVLILILNAFILKAQVKIDDIKFNTEIIDFGLINAPDGKVVAVYNFYNAGPVDLIIRDIDVACGCTTPKAYKKRIPPGDSGQIVAEFDPKGILGEVTKWIHVQANFADAVHKELKFRAEITNKDLFKDRQTQDYYPGQYGYLLVMTPVVNFGRQFQNYKNIDSIQIFNDGSESFTVEAATDLPPYIKALNLPLKVDPKELSYLKIEINTAGLDTVGPIGGVAHLVTNDRFYSTKEFSYSIDLSIDFSRLKKKELKKAARIEVDKTTVDLGTIKSGALKSGTFTISNTGQSELKILRVLADCTCTILEQLPSSIEAGESVNVTVKFDSLFRTGSQKKGIRLYTNDPVEPIKLITISSLVQ